MVSGGQVCADSVLPSKLTTAMSCGICRPLFVDGMQGAVGLEIGSDEDRGWPVGAGHQCSRGRVAAVHTVVGTGQLPIRQTVGAERVSPALFPLFGFGRAGDEGDVAMAVLDNQVLDSLSCPGDAVGSDRPMSRYREWAVDEEHGYARIEQLGNVGLGHAGDHEDPVDAAAGQALDELTFRVRFAGRVGIEQGDAVAGGDLVEDVAVLAEEGFEVPGWIRPRIPVFPLISARAWLLGR